jgi:tetratricopeptide (TPR) repeat protein
MPGVFISYRRSDGGGWAGRLNDHLSLRFGDNVVWQDVEDLEVGKEYLSQILTRIRSSSAVLVVIGPHWLKDGRQRLKNSKDVLRMEIAHALRSKAAVIPTLVGGASMPRATSLPGPIAALVKRHGVALNDQDWARSMQFLFERLQQVVQVKHGPAVLPDLHENLLAMQEQYFELMIPNPKRALALARRALTLLDEQMPAYPHDHYLQMFRGYFLKNEAMSSRDVGDTAGFTRLLQESQRAFQTIKTEAELYLANAYNGIGSVTLLKEEGPQALEWIDKALALVPDHPYALHDRQEALRFIQSRRQPGDRPVR